MNRALIFPINMALFVLCCFLAGRMIAAVTGEVLAPEATASLALAPVPPLVDRSWDARQIIITRNAFNASTLTPTAALPTEEEEYAKTKLPLRLLGTAAHEEATYSWAAIEDLETREHHVVRVGERLKGRADVLRIERRRIVLQNGARREELALEGDEGKKTRRPSSRAAARRPSSRAPRGARAARPPRTRSAAVTNPRVERLGENRFAVDRQEMQNLAANPAALLSSNQARILPKYENGQMVGLQVNAIQAGSVWQQIGVRDGDTITEFNGVQISGQEGGQALLQQLSSADEIAVKVLGRDGQERVVNGQLQ